MAFAFLAIADARCDRDIGFLEQAFGKLEATHALEPLGQLRPGEHRGGGRGNFPPCPTEGFDQHVAPLLVQLAIGFDDILRPVERSAGGGLDRGESAVVEIALHPRQRRDQLAITHREAHPPAGHGIGLGHRGEFHRDLLGALRLHDRGRRHPVEIELRIGEIRDHPDPVLARPVDHPLVKGEIDHLGGGVGGVVDDQHGRARDGVLHRPVELLPILLVRRGRNRADGRPGDDETESVDRVGRARRQHHIARCRDRGGEACQPLLRPHRHHDLALRVEFDPEAALVIAGLRAAQPGDALGLRIAMRIRFARHFAQFVDDMRRRGLVGIAHPQIDNVAPCLTRGVA